MPRVYTRCVDAYHNLPLSVYLNFPDSYSRLNRNTFTDIRRLRDKTKVKIAEECGLSEGAIRKRVKKLAQTLRENTALKNYFE